MSHDYKTSPTPEYRFFLLDPEWGGMMFFKSEADRAEAAKDTINAYRDLDNGWSEEVEFLYMGEVTHLCTQTNVVNRPLAEELDEEGCDGGGFYWGPDIELRCGYEMLPLLKPEAKTDTMASKIRRQLDLLNRLQMQVESACNPVNAALQNHLDTEDAHMVYQQGDGWVVCWGSGSTSSVDVERLLTLSREEAYAYLEMEEI